MQDCLFCKIAGGEISTDFVAENDDWVAFKDLHPKAPVHTLIIPKKHIVSLNEAVSGDALLLGNLLLAVQKVAQKTGIAESGYRTITNTGEDGGQLIKHLHFHVLGGTKIGVKGQEL